MIEQQMNEMKELVQESKCSAKHDYDQSMQKISQIMDLCNNDVKNMVEQVISIEEKVELVREETLNSIQELEMTNKEKFDQMFGMIRRIQEEQTYNEE